jgi:hypothetical protein
VQALLDKQRRDAEARVFHDPSLDCVVQFGRPVEVVNAPYAQVSPDLSGLFRVESMRLDLVGGFLGVVLHRRGDAAIHIELAGLFFDRHAAEEVANAVFNR